MVKNHTRTRLALGLATLFAITSIGLASGASATGDKDTGSGKLEQLPDTPIAWMMVGPGETSALEPYLVCSLVPEGTILVGKGVLSTWLRTKTRDGVTTEYGRGHGVGTAVDQDGNTYNWEYEHEAESANAEVAPTLFHGTFDDAFRLSGNGPIELRNGFEAVQTEDRGVGTFGFYPEHAYGDPFQFPSGPNRCDPL